MNLNLAKGTRKIRNHSRQGKCALRFLVLGEKAEDFNTISDRVGISANKKGLPVFTHEKDGSDHLKLMELEEKSPFT